MSCCPTEVLPVKTTYDRCGDNVYITGKGTKGLLFIPDIFGPHPNAYHVADILAGRGFLVVMPDFFRGKEWELGNLPPRDPQVFQEWIGKHTWDNLRDRVVQGITLLKALGATSIGGVGFCWGGHLIVKALGEGLIKSGASPHPSKRITADEARVVKGPFCLLPTKDDGPLDDIRAALDEDPERKAKNVYHYFDDMHHGFVGARANFEDELNRKRANEAIDILVDFFNNTL
jgi:dienelactone hydrolase